MKIYYEEDRFVNEVLKDKEYGFLFKYPTVIDLGCNIGTFSLFIYDYAERIFAVDLAQENIENLKATILANKLTKIEPFCLAITGNNIPRGIVKSGNASGGSWYLTNKGEDITPITLCQFMDQEKIEFADLVKIDIEGMELEVFQASDFPKDRIGTIIGENHSRGNPLAVINILEKLGFKYKGFPDYHFIARKL